MRYILKIDYPDMPKGTELFLDESNPNFPVYRNLEQTFWVNKDVVESQESESFEIRISNIDVPIFQTNEYIFINTVMQLEVNIDDGKDTIHTDRKNIGNYFQDKSKAEEKRLAFVQILNGK